LGTKERNRSKLWDRQVANLQVTDATAEGTIVLRALMSAATALAVWDLCCEGREELIAFLQREYPQALPKRRTELTLHDGAREETERRTPSRPAVAARAAGRWRAT
jgi:hypothetical protein